MIGGFDPTEIIACALRPQGSWMYILTLVGFVLASWSIAPKCAPIRPAITTPSSWLESSALPVRFSRAESS